MKKFTCPDCGNVWFGETPTACTKCSCPAEAIEIEEQIERPNVVGSQEIIGSEENEIIYYQSAGVKIGSKVWKFEGYKDFGGGDSVCYFPVSSISSISMSPKHPKWWVGMILGLVFAAIGIILIVSDSWGFWHSLSIVSIICGLIFCIISAILSQKTVLTISPNNSNVSFKFDNCSNINEANVFLNPMLKCLKENR